MSLLALRHLNKLVTHSPTLPQNWCSHYKTSLTGWALLQKMSGTQKRQQSVSNVSSDDEWRIIYRLPLIRVASAFNRVKIPYGLLNTVVVPAAYALEHSSQLPDHLAGLIAAVGITSWLTLAICSLAIKDLIGIVYVNDANDRMKLAFVDYWGKRHDVYVNLDDLATEWDNTKASKFSFYQSLSLYSNERIKFKLLKRFGEIEDPQTFASIFGE